MDANRRSVVAENFPEYRIWKGLRNRCNNPRNPAYPSYGGRGITVSSRWDTFEQFLSDMGKKPSPYHSVDRVDNNGSYSPENCRWATKREQGNNRCNNRVIEFQGVCRSVSEWARHLQMPTATLEWRIRNNWTIEAAITTPILPKGGSGSKPVGARNG